MVVVFPALLVMTLPNAAPAGTPALAVPLVLAALAALAPALALLSSVNPPQLIENSTLLRVTENEPPARLKGR